MKIGLCTGTHNAADAAEAGFDFIEENVQSFLQPGDPDASVAENLSGARSLALPLRAANCFLPGALKCTGPDVNATALDSYAAAAFARAERAGIATIVFGSGGARQVPEGFSHQEAFAQLVDLGKRIAPRAQQHNVMIVIEPLNRKECNIINSVTEGAALVEAVAHPHFQLLADFYHMLVDGEPAEAIARHGPLLRHAHVAEKEGRFAPGTGGEDFGPFLRALASINYQGNLSYECNWKAFPGDAAASLKGFREQVARAGL